MTAPTTAAVVGGGTMGAGIAHVLLAAGRSPNQAGIPGHAVIDVHDGIAGFEPLQQISGHDPPEGSGPGPPPLRSPSHEGGDGRARRRWRARRR